MELYIIRDNFRIIRTLESTMDKNAPKAWRNTIVELEDVNTGHIYFFKYCDRPNHIINIGDKEIRVNKSVAYELMSLNIAREVGVNHCYFSLAYHVTLNKYGILTYKHSSNPQPLLKLTEILEDVSRDNFPILLDNTIKIMNTESVLNLLKIQLCDIITFNADRHENNILFTDSTFSEVYPYFDCDMSFNLRDLDDLREVKLISLLKYNLKNLRLLNMKYILLILLSPDEKHLDNINCDMLKLNVPDYDIISKLNESLDIHEYLPNYLIETVKSLNEFIEKLYNANYNTAYTKLYHIG